MRAAIALWNAQQAHGAMRDLWTHIKASLIAGHRLEVEVRPERRNDPQNRLLHVLLTQISRKAEWAGRRWDVEDWKRLLTAAWLRARREAAIMVPAVDGQGFDVLYRRTSQLSKDECAELITYVQAWCAERGIELEERV